METQKRGLKEVWQDGFLYKIRISAVIEIESHCLANSRYVSQKKFASTFQTSSAGSFYSTLLSSETCVKFPVKPQR